MAKNEGTELFRAWRPLRLSDDADEFQEHGT
jgi:hypothetical protein